MSEKPDISAMNKDDLATHALATYGIELDMHKSLKVLREQVQAAQDKKDAGPKKPKKPKNAPTVRGFLKHPENKRVYPATALLKARGDMIPCDAKGKPLSDDSEDESE